MIKERENVIAKVNLILQVLLTVGSFLLTCLLNNPSKGIDLIRSQECTFIAILIIPIWFILIEYSRLCFMFREQTYVYLIVKYIKIIAVGTGLLYTASWLMGISVFNSVFWMFFFVANFGILTGFKLFPFSLMRFFRKKGYNSKQILVFADDGSVDFIDRLIKTKDWGYRICGIMTKSSKISQLYQDEFTILSSYSRVDEILDNSTVDEVFYCKGQVDQDEVSELIRLCAEVGIVFRLKPSIENKFQMNSKLTLFNNIPIYVYRNVPENYFALKIKRLFDIAFSFIVLFLGSPFYLIIAIAIKLDDGGPIFFSQERVGLNGRRFQCMKFRTMVVNAEALQSQLMNKNEQTGPVFKIKIDPRVTRIGSILRKTSLDELPQFVNVLTGDMSVVGPRPPIPSEVKQYKRWQNRRLSMKPGITCTWQVSGRNNIPFEEWVRMDMNYIDNWSLKQDFIIVLKTVKVMITGDGQ